MKIEQDIDLRPYNTFGISARCKYFTEVNETEDLQDIRDFLQKHPVPFVIAGGGSNLLFMGDFPGLVILNRLKGMQEVLEDEEFVFVEASAGEIWGDLADYCVSNEWGGMENLAAIPGTVGASAVQNIGAYGVEAADVIHAVYAYDLRSGNAFRFLGAECMFDYRDSIFKRDENKSLFITKVLYRLERVPRIKSFYGAIEAELKKKEIKHPAIGDIRDVVIAIRKSKLPDLKILGSAGSFFKNPVVDSQKASELLLQHPGMPYYPLQTGHIKLAAGWLIDQCGLKGYRTGDAGVYEHQALVLVNYGNASGRDIFELSEYICRAVEEKFGVTLEREVVVIGE